MGEALLDRPDTQATSPAAALAAACAARAGWRVTPTGDGGHWLSVTRIDAALPEQGWKLHVSAGEDTALAVLDRCLPVLLAEQAAFKVAASLDFLQALNESRHGSGQVGKFLTVYPNDDAQAVRLAAALDAATGGLTAPAVPSDRALRPGSLVHYRYGGFGGALMQTPLGEVTPALRAPDGTLVPDRREARYQPPPWAPDPFLAAGIAVRPSLPSPVLNGRYVITASLFRSPRGSVYLTADLQSGEQRAVKRAYRGGMPEDGRDARDRLRHEARVLGALAGVPGVPAVHDLFPLGDDLALVMDYVEGDTLERKISHAAATGTLPASAEVARWGVALAGVLAGVHAAGYVYRDLKSPNVIVRPDGGVALVDFELCWRPEDGGAPYGVGTPGYVAARQERREPPAVVDDVYGLGALLYLAITGAEPSQSPDWFDLLRRPVALLNPAASPALVAVIERCLSPRPEDRYPSMAAVARALARVQWTGRQTASPTTPKPPAAADRDRHRARALALGDTLCDDATTLPGSGLGWLSRHQYSDGLPARDLNAGSAGALLALAEVAAESGDARHLATLTAAAGGLRRSMPIADPPLPGLYVGEAGIALALLRAGQVLGDGALIQAAMDTGRAVAALPHASPDLFNGAAGRALAHLILWDVGDD
jgi:hypothetical protein